MTMNASSRETLGLISLENTKYNWHYIDIFTLIDVIQIIRFLRDNTHRPYRFSKNNLQILRWNHKLKRSNTRWRWDIELIYILNLFNLAFVMHHQKQALIWIVQFPVFYDRNSIFWGVNQANVDHVLWCFGHEKYSFAWK